MSPLLEGSSSFEIAFYAATSLPIMSKADKSSGSKTTGLSVQVIVLTLVGWGVLALLFYALFGITAKGEEQSFGYSLGTSIFEATAYLVATVLCFRNWGSSQIVSGRNVWLGIGLGMLFYFIGNVIFSYWELGFKLSPAVSLGDLFFIPSYVFLVWGMVQAVFSRRLNLELWQKGVVMGIAIVGIAIAIVLSSAAPAPTAHHWLEAPAYAETQPLQTGTAIAPQTVAQATPAPSPAAEEAPATAPSWAVSLDKTLQQLERPVQTFYLICDVLLLVLATTLLLAFWGGRFSQSWRMIAIAAFFLYLADIWFKWATNAIPNYQSGSLPEVAWVWSGLLFGVGAALEYDLSSRSRRSGSRRRA